MSKLSMQSLLGSSYLSGDNADYLEELHEQFLKDPTSLSAEWREYFNRLSQENGSPAQNISHAEIRQQFLQLARQQKKQVVSADAQQERKQAAVDRLIAAYRIYGYLAAKTNPLPIHNIPYPPQLRLGHYPDLTPSDQDRLFRAEFLSNKQATLREIISALEQIYCEHIGSEFTYIRNQEEAAWIQQYLENHRPSHLTAEEKKEILKLLTASEGLEKYLAHKYVGQKRFSLEGGDSFIPLVHALNEQAAAQGTKEVVVGMAHRGRLNILINIFGKPPEELFQEFEGRKDYGLTSGDVKYHLGYASDIDTKAGDLHLSLAFNPSHLEFICPVLMGSVRARQRRRGEQGESEVLALMVHGDASFIGQGVVMETLSMSQTHAYKIGGAIHVVINNQIGFTVSDPKDARSSLYCTDLAKMIDAPVFHVNGDDPEAVVFAARLAVHYQKRFKKDVFIDMVCYRRLGHNEADEPAATQPLMYHFIRQHPTPRELYVQRLIEQQVCTQAEADAFIQTYRDTLDARVPVVKLKPDGLAHHYASRWRDYLKSEWFMPATTSVALTKLVELAEKLEALPEGFELQRQVGNVMASRTKMTSGELPIDWGYAETLAYATLLDQGYSIRLSGQDCERGTFAHRHAVLHDQNTGRIHIPLAHLNHHQQATFQIYDSLLSETGTMGFEYGYASTDPETLVLWEAQYGDFANGAQVIMDQFVSSAWQKWRTLSGLTLLLPHGYEGAGPEHTSARLERYLQLCAQENMQVCIPTTPAQIFHLLRRQMIRLYRTPLIIMTPKSLLRHKLAVSSLEELSQGHFQLIIPEIDDLNSQRIKRVVLCSGKVYYDLLAKRREEQQDNIAIIRIEQLYPFPHDELQALLKQYENVKNIVWCQEEPENQGAWYTTRQRLEACLAKGQKLHYVGRSASASPAAGYLKLHMKQQEDLVHQALISTL